MPQTDYTENHRSHTPDDDPDCYNKKGGAFIEENDKKIQYRIARSDPDDDGSGMQQLPGRRFVGQDDVGGDFR